MYATAFLDAIKESPDHVEDISRRFVHLLHRHGVLKNAERIVRAVEMELTHRAGGKWVEVEYAREVGAHLRRSVHSAFSPNDHIEERITPSLVGGVRLTMNGSSEIDQTLAGRMQQL
jgi:F0F1-type ATP synthase delta subunit